MSTRFQLIGTALVDREDDDAVLLDLEPLLTRLNELEAELETCYAESDY